MVELALPKIAAHPVLHSDCTAGVPPETGSQMRRLTAGSRWRYRHYPFPHIHVEDVFVPSVYEQLVAEFRGVLASGADRSGSARLAYYGAKFDGHILSFRPSLRGPLAIFASRAWLALLAHATGVEVTADINGALHHHAKGSRSGFVHKDYSACWFIDRPRPDGVNISHNALCDYRSGKTTVAGAIPRERVRAVAMIYYLNNAPWRKGDGGETGLYLSADDDVGRPAATVPPVNNSMLVFECSPRSNHSFISNRCNARNSVAMWLHSTQERAIGRWGADSILHVRN